MIDLTLKVLEDNKVWGELESAENSLLNAGHIGTHIDVHGKSKVPLEYFKTKGVLIDCSKYDQDKEIGIEVLKNVVIDKEKMTFIIFKTNIQNNFLYGTDDYNQKHHQLSWELIEEMTKLNIAFVGIDASGIRRGKEHGKADLYLEKNKIYVVENLDLSAINDTVSNFNVYTMWIDNPFSTGLSSRILAELVKSEIE